MSVEAQAGPVILCDVFVPGHAKTKGSLEHIGNGQLRDKLSSKVWRKLIAERVKTDMERRFTAMRGFGVEPFPCKERVAVRVISYMQTATGREGWLEKAKAWLLSQVCGDSDKLARNVLDAIGCLDKDDAWLIVDDAQVVDLYSHKRLCMPGMMVGQQITVWVIPEDSPW